MSRRPCLAVALVILAALHFAVPAQACKSRPQPASLCTILPQSADVRSEPDGRVTSGATGIVRVAGQSKDGLWARVEVPCIGFMGWIARKDLACASPLARADGPTK